MNADAAWYPDPKDPDKQRWFDGTEWSSHVLPIEQPRRGIEIILSTSGALAGPFRHRKWRPIILTAAVALATIGGFIAGPSAIARFTVTNNPVVASPRSPVPSASPDKTLKATIGAGQALSSAVTGVPDYGIIAKARQVAADASDPQYKDCAAVKAAGKAPIYLGSPGFKASFDPDGDGVGCDH